MKYTLLSGNAQSPPAQDPIAAKVLFINNTIKEHMIQKKKTTQEPAPRRGNNKKQNICKLEVWITKLRNSQNTKTVLN